jgi:serine/threonine-protein kinase RsbW
VPRRAATLQVPAHPASLEAVRRFVAAQASEAGLTERAVEQVRMAVDEACANVVEHAYAGEQGHSLDVRVETEGDRIIVRILHTGRAFDPDSYRGPARLEESVRQRRSGGFGVFLMQRLMDEVEYLTRGRVSEVRLTKRRAAA